MKEKKQIKLKAGTKVCHINLPDVYGTLTENIKKGYPALVRIERQNKFGILRSNEIIAIRPSKLRKCTREDMIRIAINKMKEK